MNKEELYKALLLIATYRAGGQVVVTTQEFDAIKKEFDTLRIGVIEGDKILIRVLPS